jgi:hypothetical protein
MEFQELVSIRIQWLFRVAEFWTLVRQLEGEIPCG